MGRWKRGEGVVYGQFGHVEFGHISEIELNKIY